MKDLSLKAKITRQVQQMQLPDQMINRLEDQASAVEVQSILSALDQLAEQWY